MLQDMIRLPIIPKSKKDPTGQMRYVRSAEDIFSEAIRNIRDRYISTFKSIKRVTITANNKMIANRQYLFELTSYEYEEMQRELNEYVDEQLSVIYPNNWFFDDYVKSAYDRGMRAEYFNIAQQSPIYRTMAVGMRMNLEPYKLRVAYVRNRVFEEMQGLSSDIKKDLTLILSDALANGYGIDKVTNQIKNRAGVSDSRARRIARTEVLTAYRRARLDESDQAQKDYGFKTKMIWSSAFAPTSRDWHLARHGNTYTTEEVRVFYSEARNSNNCMCSQSSVLVDDDGNPISTAIVRNIERMKVHAEKYASKLKEV